MDVVWYKTQQLWFEKKKHWGFLVIGNKALLGVRYFGIIFIATRPPQAVKSGFSSEVNDRKLGREAPLLLLHQVIHLVAGCFVISAWQSVQTMHWSAILLTNVDVQANMNDFVFCLYNLSNQSSCLPLSFCLVKLWFIFAYIWLVSESCRREHQAIISVFFPLNLQTSPLCHFLLLLCCQ